MPKMGQFKPPKIDLVVRGYTRITLTEEYVQISFMGADHEIVGDAQVVTIVGNGGVLIKQMAAVEEDGLSEGT